MEIKDSASQSPVPSRLVDPVLLGTWIAERHHIWQMDFLDADKLSRYADERGLKFWSEHILELWQLGLLRADLVVSDRKFRRGGFRYICPDDQGRYLYADARQFSEKWSSVVSHRPTVPSDVRPLFHPFRYYVLYQLEGHLTTNILPMQMLRAEDFHGMLDHSIARFKHWFALPSRLEDMQKWNDTTALAIVAEPCMYTPVLGAMRWSSEIGEEKQRKRIDEHWLKVVRCYKGLGIPRIEEMWRKVCLDTRHLDPNPKIHTLLCLGYGEERIKLEGRLGGAMVLRTMAEIVRRASERTFNKILPEEDDYWRRWEAPSEEPALPRQKTGKEQAFGSNRLLGGDWKAADEFARQFGLRYGHHLRWYVEGDTELWALRWLLEEELGVTDITIINLLGHVAEKAKKGVAFRESLRADIKARRFSIVSIDGDRLSDFVPALRKATEDDDICGGFFIFNPDFEFGNFELEELEEIICKMVGATLDNRLQLHEAVNGVDNNKNLFKRAKALPAFTDIDKGKAWGKSLMELALEKPYFPPYSAKRAGQFRPVIKAVQLALSTSRANYHITRCLFRVDPQTGSPVRRDDPRETEE